MSEVNRDKPDGTRELDERFNSGPWHGFFLQRTFFSGRVQMSLELEFRSGVVRGSGADRVGEFTILGRYGIDSGEVTLQKHYCGQHMVFYRGFAEGNGIWGLWQIPGLSREGFHIWPGHTPGISKQITVGIDCEFDDVEFLIHRRQYVPVTRRGVNPLTPQRTLICTMLRSGGVSQI